MVRAVGVFLIKGIHKWDFRCSAFHKSGGVLFLVEFMNTELPKRGELFDIVLLTPLRWGPTLRGGRKVSIFRYRFDLPIVSDDTIG